MSRPAFFEELRWRGMLHDATEGAEEALKEGVQTAYAGFDPSAASLHVGNLVPVMGLVHLQRAGHRPIALVGGGTGLIGDPSGKSAERNLLTLAETAANAEAIYRQLEAFLDFDGVPNPARMRNNRDWLSRLGMLEFLREVGKHFSVNAMLRKDSVRRRLEDETSGISYTEFSYLLLQSYDYLRLFEDEGCRFQFGGADQWGNITGGIDLVRRVTGERAYGVVFPLITTASGAKFGKTEEGAVWLDPARTSPYKFYQYWLNTEDADVGRNLRFFTLLSREEIEALERIAGERPDAREAQERLAAEVTRTVHGEDAVARVRKASQVLFGGEVQGLSPEEIEEIFADVPSSKLSRERLSGEGVELVILLAETGVATSRGDARRALEQGGIYLNGERITDPHRTLVSADPLHGRFLLLRRGKKSYHLARVEG
jgi:tyrosyl-tRNA synthetase